MDVWGFDCFSLILFFYPNSVCVVICNMWVFLSTTGGADHHISLLNLGRSDEGRGVPWNGCIKYVLDRLSTPA